MQQDQAIVVHSFFVWNTWRWSHFPHVSAACFLPSLIVQQCSPQVILFYHFVSFNIKSSRNKTTCAKITKLFHRKKSCYRINYIKSDVRNNYHHCFYNFLRVQARNCKSWLLQLLQLLKPKARSFHLCTLPPHHHLRNFDFLQLLLLVFPILLPVARKIQHNENALSSMAF